MQYFYYEGIMDIIDINNLENIDNSKMSMK